ncbi:MAG: ABC transporter ATP-binding protein [Erysipelotrichaceae bacterium]
MKKILQVNQVEKIYGSRGIIQKALDGISFSVEEGEFVGIMGPSGSGKSTLLNCISTIDRVSSGDILINDTLTSQLKGKKLNAFRSHELGFIFQDFNLLPTLTAFENIALALTIKGTKPSEIDGLVLDVVKKLDITDLLHKLPSEMSGGQKQRVAAARAIVTAPSLVLADEPTGALDSKNARLLLESMDKLNEELDTTILMVTHDAFTASYANRILFIKDGRIFNELVRGEDDRKTFFKRILEITTLLGGDISNVL